MTFFIPFLVVFTLSLIFISFFTRLAFKLVLNMIIKG